MRRMLCVVGYVLVGIVFLAAPASADTVCVAGNFSSVIGTTCNVGSLTFTFNGFYSFGGGWTASALNFTPATNGFTLSFLGGPQSISANNAVPFGGTVTDGIQFDFNVVAPQGYYFNGDNVSTSASFGASGITAFADPGAIGSFTAGQAGNFEQCEQPPFPACHITNTYSPPSAPFSSTASGIIFVFGLTANNGTAYWDGSPATFTFSLDNNVPEPSTLSLLATSLLALMGVALCRKRLASSRLSPPLPNVERRVGCVAG